VGLMQVNRITWRNVYDVKGLTGDIAYNGNAGAEILYYYLTRYAISKKKISSCTAISRGQRIQPTTPVPAGLRAIVAWVRHRYGKKLTMRSGVSSKRSARVKN
jgi:hypothetical protein